MEHGLSQYEVLHKLGEGGMCVVHKARDLRLNRYVAPPCSIPPRRVVGLWTSTAG